MSSVLWLDTETYSETPIKRGTDAYMADPSFEIMLVTYALGDGPVKLWDRTASDQVPTDLLDALLDDQRYRLAAHNCQFDRTAFSRDSFLPAEVNMQPERWMCTMVQAYAHGLPGGLDKLCDIFGIGKDEAKDKSGKQLIHLFCKPNRGKRATPATHPDQWDRFCDYACKDISAMRAVHNKLPKWNYPGPKFVSDWTQSDDHKLWCRDSRVNERGFHVDLHLAKAAIVCADEEKILLDTKTNEATDGAVTAATQRDKMLAFILESHGVKLPDMKADTLKRRIEDENLPVAVRYLLELRLQSAKNSSSKYTRAVESAVGDRMRFTTQFMGAPATGRKAGRIIQPQNFMRPTMKLRDIEEAIVAVKRGCANLIYPNVPEVLGNTIRGIITAAPGRKLVASDLSAIEGRSLAWLARDERVVQFYRDYDDGKINYDSYLLAYAQTFGEDPATMSKHTHAWERQLGKPIELSCFAANTRVLTDNGVKAIVDVTLEDKLWDGIEWVNHAGLLDQGVKDTIQMRTLGFTVTGEHLFLRDTGWTEARDVERYLCAGRARVYDIREAGPRNRYTVISGNDGSEHIVHNCGYGGGVAAFLTFAMVYHIDLEDTAERIWAAGDEGLLRDCEQKYEWAKKNRYHAGLDQRTYAAFEYIKQGWRAARQPTVEWWELLADGFRNATLYPERTFHARSVAFRRDGSWLRMRLPSGRCLCFVHPRVDSQGLSFMGLDRYTRKLGRVYTHGGKIAGWGTQAFARDVLFHNAEAIEEAGYPIVLDVHDELITEPEDTDDYNVAGLNELITANKPWNAGLPLRAGGFEAYRYRKD